MFNFLLESPVAVGVLGAIITGCAAIVWIKLGHKAALITSAACLVVTILLVLLSLQVKTDREQIDSAMQQVAAAVQRNDLPGVEKFVHPAAKAGLQHARTEFPMYKFNEARITSVRSIEVDNQNKPPTAVAEIFVAVSVEANGNAVNGIRRFVRVYFQREKDQWLISDYEHFEVSAGFKSDQ